MIHTIEEKALAYAERYAATPMAEAAVRAYIAGHFDALASQWRSVEEELPSDDTYLYFVADVRKDPLGVDCAEYNCETQKFSRGDNILDPTHWMAIPSLNPEQR